MLVVGTRAADRRRRACRRCSRTAASPPSCSPIRPKREPAATLEIRQDDPRDASADARAAAAGRGSSRATCRSCVYFPPDFGARLDELSREPHRDRRARDQPRRPANRRSRIDVPSPRSSTTRPTRSRGSPHVRSSACSTAGRPRSCGENLLASRVPRERRPAVPGRNRSTWPSRGSSEAAVWAEDPAVRAVHLGADRRVLSGRRPVRRREGTRHAGNAALQPGAAQRNRVGQAADGHDLQHRHRPVEPGEPGRHGAVCRDRNCSRSCRATSMAPLGLSAAGGRSLWLLVALVPMSALFSALCLAWPRSPAARRKASTT